MPANKKTTTTQQEKKRKQEETSLSVDSDVHHKNKKNKKNSDDDNQSVDCSLETTTVPKTEKWVSYQSRVFNLDIRLVLNMIVNLYAYDIFFNQQRMKEDMIKIILQTYEATLMIDQKPRCCEVKSHGTLHINENSQYKRNKCKMIENSTCKEAYMCVHSEEFTPETKLPKTNNLFVFDNWLIYRCDQMKGSLGAFSTLHGQMIGDNTHTKTIHWLGIHENHCTIRKIDCEIRQIVDTSKKDLPKPEMAMKEEILEELEKVKQAPVEILWPKGIYIFANPPAQIPPSTPAQPSSFVPQNVQPLLVSDNFLEVEDVVPPTFEPLVEDFSTLVMDLPTTVPEGTIFPNDDADASIVQPSLVSDNILFNDLSDEEQTNILDDIFSR